MTTALVLFAAMGLLFACNAPIALAVGGSALAALLWKGGMDPAVAVQRLYAGADSFPLLAVPLFLMAGHFMSVGGISRRIITLAEALVGHLPGGLAVVSVVAAMFFAGVSGSAAADTAAVGTLLIPAMTKRGIHPAFAAAIQGSAGSIGIVIPPSIPMVVFGALTGASIGRLFAGGILPGLLMGLSLCAWCIYDAKRKNMASGNYSNATAFAPTERATLPGACKAPPLPDADSRNTPTATITGHATNNAGTHNTPARCNFHQVLAATRGAVWALGAPVIILGGILGGVFTATESAGVAVAYSLVVGTCIHRELTWRAIPALVLDAAITSGMIMSIIAAASLFSWVMAMEQLPRAMADMLLSVGGEGLPLLLVVNIFLLLAGCLIETTAALILFVPVLMPLLPRLGIDEVQLGVIMVVNLAIGMVTPPLGICLTVAASIARTSIASASRALLPLLGVLLVDLAIIVVWPPLITLLGGK